MSKVLRVIALSAPSPTSELGWTGKKTWQDNSLHHKKTQASRAEEKGAIYGVEIICAIVID